MFIHEEVEVYEPPCKNHDHWLNMLVDGECHSCGGAFKERCPQCKMMVKVNDVDPRAGMCGICISDSMAEAGEFFATRGLVASAEEMESHD